MRQGQNSKRSRGRGSGSGRRSNVPARHQTFDSNGPSVRIRGSAFQVHEKYLTMARDAATAGDRIAAENYQQHAEHYFRIINADNDGDARGRGGDSRSPGQPPRDEGFGDDGDSVEAVVEPVAQPPSNGADGNDIGEGSEQPVVEFPNGEDAAADGSAGQEAKAPAKPRAPRAPRTPRTPHGRSRGPRGSGKSGDGETPPTASDD